MTINVDSRQAGADTPREAFTISEWCAMAGISRAFFYKLSPEQRPAVVKLGRKPLITRKAAADWQDRMTAAATGGAEAA